MKRRTLLPCLCQISQRFTCHTTSTSTSSNPFLFLSLFSASTSQDPSPQHFIVDFLVQTLGYPMHKASSASKNLLHLKSREKPDSVLKFFRQFGFSDAEIASTVQKRPTILTSDVNTTLIPKFNLLQDLGASPKEIAHLVSISPGFLSSNIQRKLLPVINILRQALKGDGDVLRAIKRCPWLLTSNVDRVVSQNVALLQSKGLTSSKISFLFLKGPRLLVSKPESLKLACELAEELGLTAESGMYCYALIAMVTATREAFQNKLEILQSFGFTKSDLMLLFKRSPGVVTAKDESLTQKLGFLINTLGYDPLSLVRRPNLLHLSLELRLMPRHRVLQILQSKGLLPKSKNLSGAFFLPEEKFLERYVSKFKDEELVLREAYKGVYGDQPSHGNVILKETVEFPKKKSTRVTRK